MKPHFPWFAKAFSFDVVAVFLVWQVSTRSLVAYLSSVAPEAALRLRSNDPDSLINLADKALNPYADGRSGGVPPIAPRVLETTGPTQRKNVFPGTGKSRETEEVRNKAEPTTAQLVTPPLDRAFLRQQVELALSNDPLNARALRILGQLAEEEGDEERATRFMRSAARLSVRERVANYWLMRKSFVVQDYAAAICFRRHSSSGATATTDPCHADIGADGGKQTGGRGTQKGSFQ